MHELCPPCGQKVDNERHMQLQYVNIGNGHLKRFYDVDGASTQSQGC